MMPQVNYQQSTCGGIDFIWQNRISSWSRQLKQKNADLRTCEHLTPPGLATPARGIAWR
jgi:hypothetical protein